MKTEKEILTAFKDNIISLEIALDKLADIGLCPNLLNDDNGFWAVAFDGFQSISMGKTPVDVKTSFFVEKQYWKKTPRKALLCHLTKKP